MKPLLNIYKLKLNRAINELNIAQMNTETTPAESEEEAEFLFQRSDKILISAKQRVDDLREFISDIELYLK